MVRICGKGGFARLRATPEASHIGTFIMTLLVSVPFSVNLSLFVEAQYKTFKTPESWGC